MLLVAVWTVGSFTVTHRDGGADLDVAEFLLRNFGNGDSHGQEGSSPYSGHTYNKQSTKGHGHGERVHREHGGRQRIG